jgi:hypothetical protein
MALSSPVLWKFSGGWSILSTDVYLMIRDITKLVTNDSSRNHISKIASCLYYAYSAELVDIHIVLRWPPVLNASILMDISKDFHVSGPPVPPFPTEPHYGAQFGAAILAPNSTFDNLSEMNVQRLIY